MLDLLNSKAEIFFPNDSETDLTKTTHLGIGAHQDDLEIFAIHGVLEAYDNPQKYFSGVTVTDGRGAPRSGTYAGISDDDLWAIRVDEQKKAASLGRYLAQFLLNHASKSVKTPPQKNVIEDLQAILKATNPEVIYTHNLADKHDTHVAVALSVISALRCLDPPPQDIKLYGCEVWRSLDWLPDKEKIAFDVSHHADLQEALIGVFKSQIAGGKRYDLATMGRRLANATYHYSHETDQASRLVFAMDLTPLVYNTDLMADRFIANTLSSFAEDVTDRIKRFQKEST